MMYCTNQEGHTPSHTKKKKKMTKNDWLDVWHTNLRAEIADLISDGYSQADAMQWMLSWARRNRHGYSASFANYILETNRQDYGS